MYKSLFFAKSFWTSKLGQAALASIAAMTAMVIFTSHFDGGEAHAATFAQPHAAIMIAELG
ncbi:hypothetical protein [Erythrobacter sp. MTPC3]|uniref:hypothetical protein n=1 Tax=Erythrobacter sp. MTPC3 TaxID=3056564 RepID=UPI0036F3B81F